MPSFDSLIVGEEWISEHYFTTDSTKQSFLARTKALRKVWAEAEKDHHTTPRRRFFSGATALAGLIGRYGERPTSELANTLNIHVRSMLGYPAVCEDLHAARGSLPVEAPNARLTTGNEVLVLQAQPVSTVEDLFDPVSGRLVDPIQVDGDDVPLVTKALSELYRIDNPPRFIVVIAGPWVLVTEASRWPEGRYLAVNVGLAAERATKHTNQEVEYAAACAGRESFWPSAEGTIWWSDTLEDSIRHTVGVTEDLRRGIRDSVEIIANDVVRRRAARGLTMNGVDPNLLAKQALRFLYRILFVLYAEASPELQVLPTGATEYEQGYGVDRLRDLTLVQLTSQAAQQGTHLYDSLALLFHLIDTGHHPRAELTPEHDTNDSIGIEDANPGLEFNALRADLFAPTATALIDEVKLSNQATQVVLQNLLLTNPDKKGDRGFISYAELGINQLGSVYEGLMSYSGFFAEEDLYEVAPKGDATNGSWVLPVSQADSVAEKDFVKTTNPTTGATSRVLHPTGTFVYRLSNRERQRSASYYSPEVLTRFVVTQTLAEYLDQSGHTTTAEEILHTSICEPALGSGAFAIEAVRQLANEYLKRRQSELGTVIPAEEYPQELQKVKAYLALHQVYGVDLNATAVELAEVSLWLDTMFAGLNAPWFGLHLRRGNSLVGARRQAYPRKTVEAKGYLDTPGTPLSFSESAEDRIYQFLLPRNDWAAAANHKEAKAYAKPECDRLRTWRKGHLTKFTKTQLTTLQTLSGRVDDLWNLSARRMAVAEEEIHRRIEVWGQDTSTHTNGVSREQVETVLSDPNSSFRRLHLIMDAWLALSYWPLTNTHCELPTRAEWLEFLTAVLGVRFKDKKNTGPSLFSQDDTWLGLDDLEESDQLFAQCADIPELIARTPWLQEAQHIAEREGFFHWELEFSSVFQANGGFDVIVGNPPWVRPALDEAGTLAELDAWWQLNPKAPISQKNERKAAILEDPAALDFYLDEVASVAGTVATCRSPLHYGVLHGLQIDLYRCFMVRTWSVSAPAGVVGLIHPESHFKEARAAEFRAETYTRLRRHFHFLNELRLFEIDDRATYGVHVYSKPAKPHFIQMVSLYHPDSATRSFHHDGSGPLPALKNPEGGWDLRPHKERLTYVDANTLTTWAEILEEPGTNPLHTRMLYLLNKPVAEAAAALSSNKRLRDYSYQWSRGWDETFGKKDGYFHYEASVPESLSECILIGPQFGINQPFYRSYNENPANSMDHSVIDPETIGEHYIPRTYYALSIPLEKADKEYPHWENQQGERVPSSRFFRVAWRRMLSTSTFRTLQPCLFAPGTLHPHTVHTITFPEVLSTTLVTGLWSSIVIDFLVKVSTPSDANISFLQVLPVVLNHPLAPEMLLRTLRLNCMTADFAELWKEVYDPAWTHDTWVPGITTNRDDPIALGDITPHWTMDTPLRRAQDRRQAQVEIDALAALMLGLTKDQLSAIYNTYFQVLKFNYEDKTIYDRHGRALSKDDTKTYLAEHPDTSADTADDFGPWAGRTRIDRERDMRLAYDHFHAILQQRAGSADTAGTADAADAADTVTTEEQS